MIVASLPANEVARLAALRDYDVLDTLPEEAYDSIARMAAQICGVPIAAVSLVEDDRQWFKAKVGLDADETSRDVSFCAHALLQPGVFVVPDATLDARFSSNPLVTGGPQIRFYAGAPLTTPGGESIGALCVIDQKPRVLTLEQSQSLQSLSQMVMANLELRRTMREMSAAMAERAESEEARRRGEALTRAILESASDCIMTMDTAERVVEWNPAAERTFGYARGEAIGSNLAELIMPKNDETRSMMAYLAGGNRNQETRARRADGREFPVELTAVPAWVGEEMLLTIYLRDVTERRQAEDDRQKSIEQVEVLLMQTGRSEQLLRTVIDATPDWIFVKDASFHYVLANKSFADAIGKSVGEIVGSNDIQLGFPPEQVLGDPAQGITGFRTDDEAVLRGETRPSRVEPVTIANGEARIFDTRKLPLRDLEGQIIAVLGYCRDITSHKQMECQLAHAQKLESIGQLAAGVAHEINTPTQYIGDNTRFLSEAFNDLRALLHTYAALAEHHESLAHAFADAGDDADLPYLLEEIPRALTQTQEGVAHVARIVGAMKEFSHPGTEEKTLTDLNRAIDSTLTVARNEWKYVADVHTDFDPNLPPVLCLPGPLNQVWLNIIVNAAHAIADALGPNSTAHGCIRISTRRIEHERGDNKGIDSVEVRIQDSGTGMPENVKARIFDPFFTTKEVGKGTGQGLSIAHAVVVEKHNGTIEVQTQIGQGTTFIITLPLGESTRESAGEQ